MTPRTRNAKNDGGELAGMAVHIAARVVAQAAVEA